MWTRAETAPSPDGLKTGHWVWARTAMDGSNPHVQVFIDGVATTIPCESIDRARALLSAFLQRV